MGENVTRRDHVRRQKLHLGFAKVTLFMHGEAGDDKEQLLFSFWAVLVASTDRPQPGWNYNTSLLTLNLETHRDIHNQTRIDPKP